MFESIVNKGINPAEVPDTVGDWTCELQNKIALPGPIAVTEKERAGLISSGLVDPVVNYNRWANEVFGLAAHYPNTSILTCSINYDTPLGKIMQTAMHGAYTAICSELLGGVIRENVPGALVEFGVFRGGWLRPILDHMDTLGVTRPTYGFDSFEGLPKPDYSVETPNWKEGMFSASMEEAGEYLSAGKRPHLKLIKGWFKDSFQTREAQAIKEVAYAKIDCDLYAPTVEILDFLTDRLSHGAVMVFDDWTHVLFAGETRAFAEWLPKVPHYEFESIGYAGWQYMIRVWRKGQPRIAGLANK